MITEEFPKDQLREIQQTLVKYSDVFQTPRGLPSHRLFDHKIHLTFGARPINIRPYCYPYFQKGETERLVIEMHAQGVIQPSQSPFSSPILLVRNKDGTYCFCMNYRGLNSITVKDKFPIPTIKGLFYELGHAK